MIWFDPHKIPAGRWPFLTATRNGLQEIERGLAKEIDLTEGTGDILITGCAQAYRQAVVRRALDLAQSVVALWNLDLLIGSVVSARALLETVATYHSFILRAQTASAESRWETIGDLVDAYAFSTSTGLSRGQKGHARSDDTSPPPIGKLVKAFLRASQPGMEPFWDQICDTAHPNGKRMLSYAGNLQNRTFRASAPSANAPLLFIAVYNALYSCCWLIASDMEFDILLETIRSGEKLHKSHPMVVDKDRIDQVAKEVDARLRKAKSNARFGGPET